jgi:hypothetical protein
MLNKLQELVLARASLIDYTRNTREDVKRCEEKVAIVHEKLRKAEADLLAKEAELMAHVEQMSNEKHPANVEVTK